MTIEEAVQEIKRRHRLSETDIAAVLGISGRTLARWMSGDTRYPPKGRLRVIEALLQEGDMVKTFLDELYKDLLKSHGQKSQPVKLTRFRGHLMVGAMAPGEVHDGTEEAALPAGVSRGSRATRPGGREIDRASRQRSGDRRSVAPELDQASRS